MLATSQLVTGEIPTHRPVAGSVRLYAPNCLLTALAHDALGTLDPTSPWSRPEAWLPLPVAERRQVGARIARLRTRIRRFLAWQEEADGTWRFHGRASEIDPDAATTACAAIAVSCDPPPPHVAAACRRRGANALARFRSTEGSYYTFAPRTGPSTPVRKTLASLGASRERLPQQEQDAVDRIANVHVLRFVAMAGAPDAKLLRYVTQEIQEGRRETGSPKHPDPVCFAHAVARTRAQASVPDGEWVAGDFVPWLLARQQPNGSFGDSLTTALAAQSLVDLGYTGDALDRTADALLTTASPEGDWPSGNYLSGGEGSAALTTAFALGALASVVAVRGLAA